MAAVQKRFAVALDIKRPTANRDFEVVEGDTGNVLEIELTDDGAAIDLTGCRVLAVFSSSQGAAQQDTDGNGVAIDPEQNNKLTISLYAASVAPGLVECELQVYSGDDFAVLATSAKFNFMCRRGIANGDVLQATEEWPMLVSALQRVEAAETTVETAETQRAQAEAERMLQEDARHEAELSRTAFADKWRSMELSVTGLSYTEQPTAEVTEQEDNFLVSLGIPQGEPGNVNSHIHGNMTNDGSIGNTANLSVFTGDGGKLETKDAASARTALEAAKKPVILSVTLTAAGWSSGQQIISNSGIPAQSGGDLYPAPGATDAEYTAFLNAQIRTIAQAAGSLTVKALGTIPTMNIPAEIEVRI